MTDFSKAPVDLGQNHEVELGVEESMRRHFTDYPAHSRTLNSSNLGRMN